MNALVYMYVKVCVCVCVACVRAHVHMHAMFAVNWVSLQELQFSLL